MLKQKEAFLPQTKYPILKMLGGRVSLNWGFYFEIFKYMWDNFGWDPSLNMKFIYIAPRRSFSTLFLVHLHFLHNLSDDSRCWFATDDTLLTLGKSCILGPHRFCSFEIGTTSLIISSKCKSYVSIVCHQVLLVIVRLWGLNQVRVMHLIWLLPEMSQGFCFLFET